MRLNEIHLPVTTTRPSTKPVVLDDGLDVKRTSKRPSLGRVRPRERQEPRW